MTNFCKVNFAVLKLHFCQHIVIDANALLLIQWGGGGGVYFFIKTSLNTLCALLLLLSLYYLVQYTNIIIFFIFILKVMCPGVTENELQSICEAIMKLYDRIKAETVTS